MSIDSLIARGLLPDWLIRQGIRRLLRGRLRDESRGSPEARARARQAFIEQLKASPIARRMAEAQGGAVSYAPHPRGGSVFTLSLPAADLPLRSSDAARAET